MKIAYITTYDSSDLHAWSGLGNSILRALHDTGFETEIIADFRVRFTSRLLSAGKKAFYRKLLSKGYMSECEPSLLMDYAAQVEARMRASNYDIIFSPGTIPISYVQTEKPIVFWTDATFAGMIGYYPGWNDLCAETIRNGNRREQQALTKCRVAIYSSQWAANSAITHYDVDSSKVKVVPFGANISCDRDIDTIQEIVDKKSFDVCKLLFVGVDWHRKGGPQALSVANLLNKRGLKTELHIVGCTPPMALPHFAKVHGFISKKTEEGRKQLQLLFSNAHFFILPSQAECCAVVFAEASSFGLPSLATRVGGIPTAIADGSNGWTFPLQESSEEYCAIIERFMRSKDDYSKLALSSFGEYSGKLNWSVSGSKVHDLIQKYCG